MRASAYRPGPPDNPAEAGHDDAGGPIEGLTFQPSTRARHTIGRAQPAEPMRLQRQINHDIDHELATIMLLASLLCAADDVGPESRRRAMEILGESRLLHQLLRAAERSLSHVETCLPLAAQPIRLDPVAADVITAVRLSTSTEISLDAAEAWAQVDPLAFWRVLRNLVGNAVRAAGPAGVVRVGLGIVDGWTVVQVDDDGPGFGAGAPGVSSLGLGIAQDLADAAGGELEICRGALGGCCVRLRLPAAVSQPQPGVVGA